MELDYDAAQDWFQKAADLGNADAMESIAYSYHAGKYGVKQDYSKAFEWYGRYYEAGTGTDQNYDMAAAWYSKAMEAGNEEATRKLNQLYSKGLVKRP